MSKVLGLDLGTGMSCVAVIEAGKPVVVVNEEGTRTTPSVVQITKDEVKIGNAAKRAELMGVTQIHASISHERSVAVAMIILEG